MSSNVRRNDNSCTFVAKTATTFYQCLTCDGTAGLYMCANCKTNNGHNGHSIQTFSNSTDIIFCNCGDITGKYFCNNHKRCFTPKNELPLHFSSMDEFCYFFNMPSTQVKPLSRLNQIRKLDLDSTEGKLIKNYFDSSNAHNADIKFRMIFSIYRKDQEQLFVEKGYHRKRRMLLWHGTKISNIPKILKDGFRLPTAGTVANGAMFGNGVYFADRVTKSAQYCGNKNDPYVPEMLFLCEVAVGSMYRTDKSKHYHHAPKDVGPNKLEFDSVKGLGKYSPDSNENTKFDEDIIVPSGKTVLSEKCSKSSLLYNEYIVYDPKQVLIKFIIHYDR